MSDGCASLTKESLQIRYRRKSRKVIALDRHAELFLHALNQARELQRISREATQRCFGPGSNSGFLFD